MYLTKTLPRTISLFSFPYAGYVITSHSVSSIDIMTFQSSAPVTMMATRLDDGAMNQVQSLPIGSS